MKIAITKLIYNIAELFKVKTILSLMVITFMCILTWKEKLDLSAFMGIAGSIITYYFTRKNDEKNETNESEVDNNEQQ